MAQLAEQLICNQQVNGSSPLIGSSVSEILTLNGWFPEWPKGADCKSVVDDFDGSNPSPSTTSTKNVSSEEEQAIIRIIIGLLTIKRCITPTKSHFVGRGTSDESKY